MQNDNTLLGNRFTALSNPMEPVSTGETPVLQKLNEIRYVIFDFYGTLFISGVGDIGIDDGRRDSAILLEALTACGFRADRNAAERGYQLYEEEVHREQNRLRKSGIEAPEPVIESVWLNVLNAMKKEGLLSGEISMYTARLFSVEFEVRMNPVWPMPGLQQALHDIHAKGVQLGIISNSQFYTPIAFESLTGETLDELGFDPGLLHWSYKENRKKPSLEFYNRFINRLNGNYPDSKPEQVLFIGNDMLKDIWPAASLGMKTALFAGDSRSLKWRKDDLRCRDLTPDIVVTELSQISGCI
ncbi:MAG: HAD family hydrolase [Balneolaceae bacterium]